MANAMSTNPRLHSLAISALLALGAAACSSASGSDAPAAACTGATCASNGDSDDAGGPPAQVCSSGQTQCSGNAAQTCSSSGQWSAPTACNTGEPCCSGACVNDDPNNCGACGQVCSGACQAGECIVTIASGQLTPTTLAVDATSVYWTNTGTVHKGEASVMKAPIGGGAPVTLASGQNFPLGIAIDSANVYWTDNYGSTVSQMPLAGGAPVTIASQQCGPLRHRGRQCARLLDEQLPVRHRHVGPDRRRRAAPRHQCHRSAVSGPASRSTRRTLYWTNSISTSGSVMSVDPSGGAPSRLPPGRAIH